MTESSQLSHASPLVELRYFAALRDEWELLLLRARQLGVRTIVARVPCAWHALTENTFDFEGTTDQRRDLVGFVRLCGRFGLHVLLHPGPLHGDLLGGGVPAWLLQQHPAACALGPNGAPWRDAGGLPHPNALHPAFLVAARDWVAAFSAAMRPLQAPAGPIIALHTSAPDRLDYNQVVANHPGAPEPQIETFGAFSAWHPDTAASATADWLRVEGWSVALRRGQPWEADRQARAQLLELPGRSHPLLDAATTSANGLLRSDGSPRLDFWPVKMSGLLIAAAGEDAANASAPADMALADAHPSRYPAPTPDGGVALAQRLRHASVAFDMLDLEAATPQELARYTLIILPGARTLPPSTQQKLAQCANIMLLDDRADAAAFNIDAEDDLAHTPTRPRATHTRP
ncbi:MAG: beta-galactosidase [Roseiflexaceae bacterium]